VLVPGPIVKRASETRHRSLTHAEAKAFYDRLGSWLDTQSFYENPALAALVAHGRFDRARAVFELGCGTGRLATSLLTNLMPHDARYVGTDISATMVRLAADRLKPWASRVEIRSTDGSTWDVDPPGSYDRFVSTYVLDLLSEDDIGDVLDRARRLLAEDGLLCLVSLACGSRGMSRIISALWTRLHAWSPRLVGGCQPIDLNARVSRDSVWHIEHHEVIVSFGIASEVVVASKGA
jgi:cyclopropane fatty-acyl-phospholipid synthase-like methyltransferase